MACKHKFEKYLNLLHLDFEPSTLVIGTFNPAWPHSNYATWFYGRTQNNYFWDVLPRIYGEAGLINEDQKAWKRFCRKYQIAITDLIACINDANENSESDIALMASYSDKAIACSFKDFDFTDIQKILKQNPSIKNVYLTRGANDLFWKKQWSGIQNSAKQLGIHTTTLLTPSSYARFQNKVDRASSHKLSLSDFILMKWKEKWHNHKIELL